MKRFSLGFLFTIFTVFLAASTGFACPSGSFDVSQNGAVPNDANPDSSAIQSAVANTSNSVVCIPAGLYLIDSQIDIDRDDLVITGDGVDSILRLESGTNVTIFRIGAKENTPGVAHNIVIQKLFLDGDGHTGQTSSNANFFGIFVEQGEDVVLRDLYLDSFVHDSIAAGAGYEPNKDLLIERVRVNKAGRNAIAILFAEGVIIRDCVLDSNQDPGTWGAVSGNGIDVEVEGQDPVTNGGWVTDLTIENNVSTHTNLNSGGTAITLQPAYGPIDGVDITGNIAIEKGIVSRGAGQWVNQNVNINSNWVGILDATAGIWAYAFSANDTGTFNDNVATNYSSYYYASLLLSHSKNISGADNKFYRPSYANYFNLNGIEIPLPYTANENCDILDTLDNGHTSSRIVYWDWISYPQTHTQGTLIGDANSQATWVTNNNSTPTGSPSITGISVSGKNLLVTATDPSGSPMKVVVLLNGLPIGMAPVVSGTATVPLQEFAVSGDDFEVRAYNHHGKNVIDTYTH